VIEQQPSAGKKLAKGGTVTVIDPDAAPKKS